MKKDLEILDDIAEKKSGGEQFSFKVYVDSMQECHHDIHSITGEHIAAVYLSPLMETLRKKGLLVLLMLAPVDEYAVAQLN